MSDFSTRNVTFEFDPPPPPPFLSPRKKIIIRNIFESDKNYISSKHLIESVNDSVDQWIEIMKLFILFVYLLYLLIFIE